MKGLAICTVALGLLLATAATSQAGNWYPGSYIPAHYHHHYYYQPAGVVVAPCAGLWIRGVSDLPVDRGPLPGSGAADGGSAGAILLRRSRGGLRLSRQWRCGSRRVIMSRNFCPRLVFKRSTCPPAGRFPPDFADNSNPGVCQMKMARITAVLLVFSLTRGWRGPNPEAARVAATVAIAAAAE